MPGTRSRLSSRQKQILAVLALLILFVAALVLYAGRTDNGKTALPTPSSSATPSDSTGAGASDAGVTPSPTASGTATGTGLAALPGLPDGGLPDSTQLTTLGPGKHRVVLTARSDKPLLAVSYVLKGDAKGRIIYNVKSPVSIARTISGERPYAAIGLQVGPTGTTGSCTVTIDGKVVDTKRVNAAYAVMQCLG